MRLSRTQAFVITLLNAVIAALVAVIFFFPLGGASPVSGQNVDEQKPDVPVQPEEPQHVKLREASIGAVPEIERETRLMGLGDETVVSVYNREGVGFIFGNATVKGLDFDSYGGFLCLVNSAGTILSFTYFDGVIGAVGVVGNGYAVGAGENLYFVDYTGEAQKMSNLDGTAVDIVPVSSGKIAAVTQPGTQSLKLTEYALGGDEWTVGNSTRINGGFDLRYFDTYVFVNSYVISARASLLPKYDSIAFYSFSAGGDPTAHYYGGSDENITRPYAVMPCEAGYFALTAKNGLATLITVDKRFEAYHAVSLGFTFTDASLSFVSGRYYGCFDRTDGALTYELENNLSRVRLSTLDGIAISKVEKIGDGILAFGKSADGREVIVQPHSGEKLYLEMNGAEIGGAYSVGGSITLMLSATGGAALSAPTGGRDVYTVTLKAGAISTSESVTK